LSSTTGARREGVGQAPGLGEHRGEDDPVDLAVEQRLDEPALDVGVALGLTDEQHQAALVGRLERALDEVARELRRRDGVRHEAEREPGSLAQPDGQDVAAVAQLGGDLLDALLHALGDPQLDAAPRQHERRRRRRHPGRGGDVGEGHPPANHGVLLSGATS